MKIRDRIKAFRRVSAAELRPNPKNWRAHGQAQQDAMRGLLAEIGFAGAALARELDDGSLMLIDGHLRADVAPSSEIPVLILDVNEDEADKILATFDRVTTMADVDEAKLGELVADLTFESDALAAMFEDLDDAPATTEAATTKTQVIFEANPNGPGPDVDDAPTGQEKYGVLIECTDEDHQLLVHEWVKSQGYKCKVLCD